ncbi:peptidoglycan editing factor PgeF [Lentibacillus halophilus]|uniref:Purine nucleoside phosphorylase n=1 Tax=Lentibacillus halophilus TaxID=295065 RepID=A0ABN0ZGE7_9BACI
MTEPFQQLTQSVLAIEKWQAICPDLRAGFTTRQGGCSSTPFHSLNLGMHVSDIQENVVTNRQRLTATVPFPLSSWVSGEQTHQTTVHAVTPEDMGKGAHLYKTALPGVDGLITEESGILCTAYFADCVPIYFVDPVSKMAGIAHAGWRGTVHRICEKMVQSFQAKGTNPSDLLAVIGPCISGEAYEVDEHVIRYIPDEWCAKTVTDQGNGRFLLDLKQLNAEILLQQGVIRRNIDVTQYCTFRDESLFFSHRRDYAKTGRMLGYIGFVNGL